MASFDTGGLGGGGGSSGSDSGGDSAEEEEEQRRTQRTRGNRVSPGQVGGSGGGNAQRNPLDEESEKAQGGMPDGRDEPEGSDGTPAADDQDGTPGPTQRGPSPEPRRSELDSAAAEASRRGPEPLRAKDPDMLRSAVAATADRFRDEQEIVARQEADRRIDTLEKAARDTADRFRDEQDIRNQEIDEANQSALEGAAARYVDEAREQQQLAATEERFGDSTGVLKDIEREIDSFSGDIATELRQQAQEAEARSKARADKAGEGPTGDAERLFFEADAQLGESVYNVAADTVEAPSAGIEALEAGAKAREVALRGGQEFEDFSDDLSTTSEAAVDAQVKAIEEDPEDFASELLVGAAAGAGVSRAARIARAADVSVTGRGLRSVSLDIPERAPSVSIRKDPTSGPLDVDPLLKQQLRESVSTRNLEAPSLRDADVSVDRIRGGLEARATRARQGVSNTIALRRGEIEAGLPNRPRPGAEASRTRQSADLEFRSLRADLNEEAARAKLRGADAVFEAKARRASFGDDVRNALGEADIGPDLRDLKLRGSDAVFEARARRAQVSDALNEPLIGGGSTDFGITEAVGGAGARARLAARRPADAAGRARGRAENQFRSFRADLNEEAARAQFAAGEAFFRGLDARDALADIDAEAARGLGRKTKQAEISARLTAEAAIGQARSGGPGVPTIDFPDPRDYTLRVEPIRPPRRDQVLSDLDVLRGGEAGDDLLGEFADDSLGGANAIDDVGDAPTPADDVDTDFGQGSGSGSSNSLTSEVDLDDGTTLLRRQDRPGRLPEDDIDSIAGRRQAAESSLLDDVGAGVAGGLAGPLDLFDDVESDATGASLSAGPGETPRLDTGVETALGTGADLTEPFGGPIDIAAPTTAVTTAVTDANILMSETTPTQTSTGRFGGGPPPGGTRRKPFPDMGIDTDDMDAVERDVASETDRFKNFVSDDLDRAIDTTDFDVEVDL